MKNLVLVAVACLLLAGCSLIHPDPAPEPTTAQPTPTVRTPAPTPIRPTPTPTATPSVDAGISASMTCEVPSAGVKSWIDALGAWTMKSQDAVMVQVGEGSVASEQWWVVAIRLGGTNGNGGDQTYLTNQPSPTTPSGVQWISVGQTNAAGVATKDWSKVVWTTDQLTRGLTAQAKAISCLPSVATSAQPTPRIEPPISTFALTCSHPTSPVMDWLRAHGDSGLSTNEVAMVDVGVGDQADSDWWVFAARGGDGQKLFFTSWLTDSPSKADQSQALWISLYSGSTADKANWSAVDWSQARTDRGMQAQTMAIGCVPW